MAEWQRTHICNELREEHVGQTVTLNGWVLTTRKDNFQVFVDIRDRYGLTQIGPHRDDLIMLLGGRALRAFGSAGQHRTAAIALRTLEAETLRDARGASPVFLLDDPFAELDVRRAARVLTLLREVGLGQTILAVPRDSDIPNELTELPRYRVADGRVELRKG